MGLYPFSPTEHIISQLVLSPINVAASLVYYGQQSRLDCKTNTELANTFAL